MEVIEQSLVNHCYLFQANFLEEENVLKHQSTVVRKNKTNIQGSCALLSEEP